MKTDIKSKLTSRESQMINVKNRIVDEISTISVMNDKEVVRLEFKIKNQVTDLLKLTDCVVYINYMNGSLKDRYLVTDLSGDDEVTFSWTLGRNATAKQGKTFFVICAQKMNGTEIEKEWNSVLTSFDVKKGLETLTAPVEPYTDIFSQLTEMIEDKQDKLIAGENITIEGNVISATGGGGDSTPIFYADTTSASYNIYLQLINDETLVDGKFAVLMTTSGVYNGTDDENAGIDAISYHSYEAMAFTADEIESLLSGYDTALRAYIANLYYNKQETENLISALGAVFSFKGTVATTSQLPLSGNTIGDVYYVTAKSLEYVWINDGTARWEPLGEIVDLSAYYTKTEADSLLNGKVAIAQGDADKQLTTDANGNVITEARPTIGGVTVKGAKSLADFGIQGTLTAALGIEVLNNVISAHGVPLKAVTQLPTTAIDADTTYLMTASHIFPDATSYVDETWGKIAVCYDYFTSESEKSFRMLRLKTTSNDVWEMSNAKAKDYEIYDLGSNAWVKTLEGTNSNAWGNLMKFPASSLTAITNIYYSNCTFSWSAASRNKYNTANNKTYITGIPVDVSTLNPFLLDMFIYRNSAWQNVGQLDLTSIFSDVLRKSLLAQGTGTSTTNVMSQKAVTDELALKANASALADYVTSATYNTGMETKQNVVSKVTLADNSTTALADNTEYSGSNLTTVTFTYPQGDFECYMKLAFASSGTITVTFPTSQYIGSVPTFENDKTYEISIKNGVIVAGEVTSGA